MFYLKKIKTLYLDIIFVTLTSFASSFTFLNTMDFFIGNLKYVYLIVSVLMGYGLYYLQYKQYSRIRKMINIISLIVLAYIFYCLSLYTNNNIYSLLSFVNIIIENAPIVALLTILLFIYWFNTVYVNVLYRKKYYLFGLFPLLLIIGVEYSLGLVRNPFMILIVCLVFVSSYVVSAPMKSKYELIQPLHIIVIVSIIIVITICAIFIPYNSYAERPFSDYFMNQQALKIQSEYEERNGYVEEEKVDTELADTNDSTEGGNLDAGDETGENGKNSGSGLDGGSSNNSDGGIPNGGLELIQTKESVCVSGDKGAESDLKSAGNMSLDGKTVVLYISSTIGPISTLLRGSSAAHYNNGKWSYLNAIETSAISGLPQSLSYAKESANGLNGSMTSMTITEISKLSATKYFPYYTSNNDKMALDCYVRGATTYNYSDVLYNINSMSLLNKKASNTNSTYDAFVKKSYTSIDKSLNETLKSYLKKNNITESMSLTTKVKAVQNLLANTCTYTLKPGNCPSDKEPTEYFLFENKKGYCMHFASTGTLLLRSLGVPTRYCTGYMLTESKFEGNTACITAAQSHAWSEVYREGIGWVPVDFTPSSSNSGESASMMPVPKGSAEDTKLQNVEEIKAKMQGKENKEDQEKNDEDNKKEEPKIEENKKEDIVLKEEEREEEKKENIGLKEDKKEENKKEDNNKKEEKSLSNRNYRSIFVGIIVFLISLICSLLSIKLRHLYVLRKRQREFSQDNLDKSYIAYWRYLNQLKVFGNPVDVDFDSNALKASFSNEQLLPEDIIEIKEFVDNYSYEIYNKLSKTKKLLFKYIYNLIA